MTNTVPHVPPGERDEHTLRVCIDVRPLATGHRRRGIGTYVASLLAQCDQLQERNSADGAMQRVRFTYLRAHPESARVLAAGSPIGVVSSAADPDPVAEPASCHSRDICRQGDVVMSLDEAHCDVYHATTLEGIVISPAFKTVVTLYDLIPSRSGAWWSWMRHPLQRRAYLRQLHLLTQADHIIAISEATKNDAHRLLSIPRERVSVVAPALDPTRAYVPGPEQMAAARGALDLREPYFLAVASSDRHKNLARVVRAFAAFRANPDRTCGLGGRGQDYTLYLVGTWMGYSARRLLALIARLGLRDAVVRLPWVPLEYLPALYHGATGLVFPSLMEGFGLPVLEAMACGTAVITSNRSALPEVAGNAGLYVTPESVAEIAAAMRTLATEPQLRANLLVRGRARSAEFSSARAARETLAVYRRVAAGEDGVPPDASGGGSGA